MLGPLIPQFLTHAQPMHHLIEHFFNTFKTSFKPPKPYRGKSGNEWLVSGDWSHYISGRLKSQMNRTDVSVSVPIDKWLNRNFRWIHEMPVRIPGDPENKQRLLDGALWLPETPATQKMDYALEWEWDDGKVHSQFAASPFCDFRKVLCVDAECGMAIVQTRVDERRRNRVDTNPDYS